ncbi:MAG: lipid II flippase MurJ, partial [Pseudomonadota bacterium]
MNLFRAAFSFSLATSASRILGYVRDMLFALAFGAGPVADAFLVALKVPNIFRRLFAEGAFAAAFVPIYTRLLGTSHRDATLFANRVLLGLGLFLAVFTLILIIAMPILILGLAPGFHDDP